MCSAGNVNVNAHIYEKAVGIWGSQAAAAAAAATDQIISAQEVLGHSFIHSWSRSILVILNPTGWLHV